MTPSPGVAATPAAAEDAPTKDEPSSEPKASPSPTRDESPEQHIETGTVVEGAPSEVSGTGSVEVTVVRDGAFAIVVHLDCADCAGPIVLTSPGRGSPCGEGDAGLVGSYLLDVFEGADAEVAVSLTTEDDWTLRFESWNDLPTVTGQQSGSGSTVLYLGDTASVVDIAVEPADGGDVFSGRFFGESGVPLMFGDSGAIDEEFELDLPGVLAITTKSSWTLTPKP